MAAGDPGSPARYYSSTAVETSLQSSIAAQSQGAPNTSFIVASISGFPTEYPYTLIVDPDTSKEEVLTVYAGSGTTLSVYRGADNTQAVAHSAGAVVRHGVSARDFRESENHIAARGYDVDQAILNAANQTHVHGLATGDGVVVGTTKAQTLTNKVYSSGVVTGAFTATSATFNGGTFTSPTINTPTIAGATISGTFTSTATVSGGTYSNAALGSALNAGGYKITNLATPTNASDAVRKDFADAQVAAAATSAASAATSASSAAASAATAAASVAAIAGYATSAANSASAAATSATSAAASATAAATSAASAATSAGSSETSAISSAASATAAATSATSAANSATAAATSATSAANSATAAATSATSAAASATTAAASVAAIAGYAAAAATSEANALTSANSAATSAASAAASTSAAAASASSAAISATDAATSAVNAATSAGSAANSATAAATSATSSAASASLAEDWAILVTGPVSGSDFSAKYNANLAADSATSAAASATSSENSATAAATSAASAATSATSAATTYDEFDDRYLGSKSSPPSVDNDGGVLQVGAIYWNSTLNNMYVWSGSAWVQIATTSVYSAPTLGTTTIDSGTTYGTIADLTLEDGLATADPTVALGIATKQYVDNKVAGLTWKAAVNLRATSNVALTGTSGTLVIDSHPALTSSDDGYRILLNGQTTSSENGIYVYSDNGTSYTLSRSDDADVYTELNGASVYVLEGSVYGGTSWVQDNYSLSSFSGQTWVQFAASVVYTEGTGITISGTTISIATDYTNDIYINAIMGVL